MGRAYNGFDEQELDAYIDRFETFLEDAYHGDVTLDEYRESVPDRVFVDTVLPDGHLRQAVMTQAIEDTLEQQFSETADWQEFKGHLQDVQKQQTSQEFLYETVVEKLENDDDTLQLHGTDLAQQYLTLQQEREAPSRIAKYATAFSRTLHRKGYERATPTGTSIDELEEEQGSFGAWLTSPGKMFATFSAGAGLMLGGAVTGDPAMADAGLATATVAAGGASASTYYDGKEERYNDAIVSIGADMITDELGSYEVDVVASYPFTLLADGDHHLF